MLFRRNKWGAALGCRRHWPEHVLGHLIVDILWSGLEILPFLTLLYVGDIPERQ
jgi:hypothetical protein